LTVLSQAGSPSAPDYDEIVEFIQTGYIDAFNQSDFSKLRRFFYEDAWFFFIDKEGTLYKAQFTDEVVREWATQDPDSPVADWEWSVLSVNQAGDVASVMFEMHSASNPIHRWIDVHALLRIDGQWHDMNKTSVHADLAGR
jgi:ketosteroid isomerase-like protein